MTWTSTVVIGVLWTTMTSMPVMAEMVADAGLSVVSSTCTPAEALEAGTDSSTCLVGPRNQARFGYSTAISHDGSILAVGSKTYNHYYPAGVTRKYGLVDVFKWNGSQYTRMGEKLLGERGGDNATEGLGDEFGSAIALSDDGMRLAVGAPFNDGGTTGVSSTAGIGSTDPGDQTNCGHVRVFEYDGSAWQQMGADIDGPANDALLGSAVDLSGDGTRLVVGAPGANAAFVYDFDNGEWTQKGSSINGTGSFGQSVAVSADGTMIAIGAPEYIPPDETTRDGFARAYAWDDTATNWSQVGRTMYGAGEGNNHNAFGTAVGLSRDGRTLAVGEPLRYYMGRVVVYRLLADMNFAWFPNSTSSAFPKELVLTTEEDGDVSRQEQTLKIYMTALPLAAAVKYRILETVDGQTDGWGNQYDLVLGWNNITVNAVTTHDRFVKIQFNSSSSDATFSHLLRGDSGYWLNTYADANGYVNGLVGGTGGRIGQSLDISDDGERLVIGGGNNNGRVLRYQLNTAMNPPTWEYQGQDKNELWGVEGEASGSSVSMSDDGNTLACGGFNFKINNANRQRGRVIVHASHVDNCGVLNGDDASCTGCTDSTACNYDESATIADESCDFASCVGCTNSTACNYDETATIDDGSCESASCVGCTNSTACNYNATATIDDGSCTFLSCASNVSHVFISEYAEGTSYNKYLELYNAGSETVDLTAYAYPNVGNGASVPGEHEFWNDFEDEASIAPGEVYVICHPSAEASILGYCNETHQYLSNGDDGYCLVYGTEVDFQKVDCVGDWEGDPGSGWDVCGVADATKDKTLVRKCDVTQGNGGDWTMSAGSTVDDCEWIVHESDTWTYLHNHSHACEDDDCSIPAGDCDCNGNQLDDCGECGGDNSSCTGCTDSTACNYDNTATIDDGSCESASCAGCTNSTACNYDNTATIDDGTCAQVDDCDVCGGNGIPEGDCDCNGNELDDCGVCGGDGIPEGDCDCNGNQLDALDVCGGTTMANVSVSGSISVTLQLTGNCSSNEDNLVRTFEDAFEEYLDASFTSFAISFECVDASDRRRVRRALSNATNTNTELTATYEMSFETNNPDTVDAMSFESADGSGSFQADVFAVTLVSTMNSSDVFPDQSTEAVMNSLQLLSAEVGVSVPETEPDTVPVTDEAGDGVESAQSSESADDETGLIVGIVVGAIVIVGVVAIALIIYMRPARDATNAVAEKSNGEHGMSAGNRVEVIPTMEENLPGQTGDVEMT